MTNVRILSTAVGCLVLVAGLTRAEPPQAAAPVVESKAEPAAKEAERATKPVAKPKPEGPASAGNRPAGAKPAGSLPKPPLAATPSSKPVKPAGTGAVGVSKPSSGVKEPGVGGAGQITKSHQSALPAVKPAAKPAAVKDLTPASVDNARHRGSSPPVLGGAASGTVKTTAALNGTGMRNRNVLK